MTGPRGILKKYGIKPTKRLGQCFLEDRNVITKIVKNADIDEHDTVLEIGAGCGIMTKVIAAKAQRVIALEVDPRMTAILRDELRGLKNVEIVEGDILESDISSWRLRGNGKLKVIGNIPYNISTQILFHLIGMREHLSLMVLMFQKEVADRITAAPGSREYGIPSVLAAMYTMPARVMFVPARLFYPSPEVDSAVLRLTVRAAAAFPLYDQELFLLVVKKAFSQRRKTLFNNLKSLAAGPARGVDIGGVLVSCGIDPSRRGETLSCREFALISNALAGHKIP